MDLESETRVAICGLNCQKSAEVIVPEMGRTEQQEVLIV
jgi:hypothetical protein